MRKYQFSLYNTTISLSPDETLGLILNQIYNGEPTIYERCTTNQNLLKHHALKP